MFFWWCYQFRENEGDKLHFFFSVIFFDDTALLSFSFFFHAHISIATFNNLTHVMKIYRQIIYLICKKKLHLWSSVKREALTVIRFLSPRLSSSFVIFFSILSIYDRWRILIPLDLMEYKIVVSEQNTKWKILGKKKIWLEKSWLGKIWLQKPYWERFDWKCLD